MRAFFSAFCAVIVAVLLVVLLRVQKSFLNAFALDMFDPFSHRPGDAYTNVDADRYESAERVLDHPDERVHAKDQKRDTGVNEDRNEGEERCLKRRRDTETDQKSDENYPRPEGE